MTTKFATVGLLIAALFISGCNETLEDISPTSEKANKPLPAKVVQTLKAKGMSTTSPIMIRIFKEEAVLEVWKQKDNGRYVLAATYDICKWTGQHRPKLVEGDPPAP